MSSILTFPLLVSIIPVSFSTDVAPISEPPTLRCHQCHSQTNPQCLQMAFNNTSFLMPCPTRTPGTQQFCRKIAQNIYARGGLEVVIRRCGWVRQPEGGGPCYQRRNHDYIGTVCDCSTDGCNSAPDCSAPAAIIVTLLLALCWF